MEDAEDSGGGQPSEKRGERRAAERVSMEIVAEFLARRGHFEALRELERDAGRDLVFFPAQAEDAGEEVDFMRELVLEGRFADVERSLAALDGSEAGLFDSPRALFCVRKQRLLELLNSDPPPGAKVLRTAFAGLRDLNVASAQEINQLHALLTTLRTPPPWTPVKGRYECFDELLHACGLFQLAQRPETCVRLGSNPHAVPRLLALVWPQVHELGNADLVAHSWGLGLNQGEHEETKGFGREPARRHTIASGSGHSAPARRVQLPRRWAQPQRDESARAPAPSLPSSEDAPLRGGIAFDVVLDDSTAQRLAKEAPDALQQQAAARSPAHYASASSVAPVEGHRESAEAAARPSSGLHVRDEDPARSPSAATSGTRAPPRQSETALASKIETLSAEIERMKAQLLGSSESKVPSPVRSSLCAEDAFEAPLGDESFPANVADVSGAAGTFGDEAVVAPLQDTFDQRRPSQPARKSPIATRPPSSTLHAVDLPLRDVSNQHRSSRPGHKSAAAAKVQTSPSSSHSAHGATRAGTSRTAVTTATHQGARDCWTVEEGQGIPDLALRFRPSACLLDEAGQPIRAAALDGCGRLALGTNGQCISITRIPSAEVMQPIAARAEPLVPQGNVRAGALLQGQRNDARFPHLHYAESENPPALRLVRAECRARNVHHGSVYALDWQDDLLASGSNDKSVKVWRYEAGGEQPLEAVLSLDGHRSTIRDVKFVRGSASATLASAGGGDNAVRLWDVATGKLSAALQGHSSAVFALEASSPGRLVSASGDGTLRCWDPRDTLPAKGLTLRPAGPQRAAQALAGCALAPWALASGHEDGVCRLWDLRSQKVLFEMQMHSDQVRSLSFSPDARWLLSGSFDGTVSLLDADSFAQGVLARYHAHRDKVLQVSWLPDRPAFVTTSADATAKLWCHDL